MTVNIKRDMVLSIWDDLHEERPGFYRAFWVAADDVEGSGSPAIGYCAVGGTRRTVKQAAAQIARLYPGVPIYRGRRRVL